MYFPYLSFLPIITGCLTPGILFGPRPSGKSRGAGPGSVAFVDNLAMGAFVNALLAMLAADAEKVLTCMPHYAFPEYQLLYFVCFSRMPVITYATLEARGQLMVSLVNSHTNATSIGWHLCENGLRFAPGLPPGWLYATCAFPE